MSFEVIDPASILQTRIRHMDQQTFHNRSNSIKHIDYAINILTHLVSAIFLSPYSI